jgi:hypothetical protein
MTNYNSIIVRDATDDFYAFQIANAMQALPNVEVFSIVFQDGEPLMFGQPRGRWLVFAKYASDKITPDQIDGEISKELNGQDGDA